MREYRLQEPMLDRAITNGAKNFAMRAYVDNKPEMHEVIVVVDPVGWRVEAKVTSIVTPADFESVGQVELLLEPTATPVKGRLVECNNVEHPTGWKWVP